MKKRIIVILVVAAIFGSLFYLMKLRAPKPAPPTTEQIWEENGIPVETTVITTGDMNQTVSLTGNLTALDSVNLSAKIGGRVAAVNFREGDAVKAGAVVIVLDQHDQRSNLLSAESALKSAKAALSQAQTDAKVTKISTGSSVAQANEALKQAQERLKIVRQPVRTQQISVAENNVASAKANFDNATANYNRYKILLDQGAVSQSAFEIYETQYKVAKSTYESACDQLSLAKEGSRSEEIRSAESAVAVAQQQLHTAKANEAQNLLKQESIKSAKAAVSQAEAAVAIAKEALDSTYVRSSITGVMSARNTEPGQVVAAGQSLGEVVNLNSVYFKGDVSEKVIDKIRRNQTVLVTVDALADQILSGTVDQIYPSASTANRNFPVRIRIDNASEYGIKPGMFARGNIVTDTSSHTMLIPKDAIADLMGNKVVFTLEKAKDTEGDFFVAKRHDVEIAFEDAKFVELKEDYELKIGDTVVTSGKQGLQNGTKVLIEDNDK